VDTGFVLALPLHHRGLELDSVGISTKDHIAVLVAWPWLGGVRCVGGVFGRGGVYAGRYGNILTQFG